MNRLCFFLGIGFLVIWFALSAPAVMACRCLPPDLAASYNNSTDVVQARVLRVVTTNITRTYTVRVNKIFKGCLKPGQMVQVATSTSSASCGATLRRGGNYLLTATRRQPGSKLPVLDINSCGFNVKFSTLSDAQRQWLSSRYNCCGNICGCVDGSQPVNCFVDPCSVAPDCPTGQCQSNYCGGCNAEFYDESGHQVCTSPAACLPNQHLGGDGTCVANCTYDKDCGDGLWCRATETQNVGECVPFQQEGETCGGFTPSWMFTKCAPGLVCTDYPPMIADAPGKCRKPCQTLKECAADQYCSSDGICLSDGTCKVTPDCSSDGNSYVHIMCAGYAYCTEAGQCGWRCGIHPVCPDLSGVDFGACEMLLGWGVVNGSCTAVSGCGSRGFLFFGSLQECQAQCQLGLVQNSPL